ncbi:MAG: DNA mismatch repair endonuclease MutL [Bacteroidetes bacterium]|nr:DNA mismatch repair endonuclease MutL [Bacteroidota bacterium]
MPDIINLLPDSVANQIAAGEVIQRPASAVKELLENSIDAQGTDIKLILKDAGRTLIQIIDNGIGMSETDARMCFERHATSKIKKADDLFKITTMGFRGEAMASIAGVAQVEMKTKRAEDELGTQIEIEGSELKNHSSCQCQKGTSISIKNLFFNVPARRNFLKSDAVELRHIIEEFQRVAIAHPEIDLSLHHNNSELFHLGKGTLRQRLVGIFGDSYNQRLVPVHEDTTIVNVTGFIGKPEFARKTRGEQFFFVNNRFIKSPYLHHALQNAYEQLLPKDAFPSYFINMEIDPKTIDVNIHPTKTEIKFEDERSVYTIMRSAVKQSLGKYNIAPSLDFEQETSIAIPQNKSREEILLNPPKIKVDKNYNPFFEEEKKEERKSEKRNTSASPVSPFPDSEIRNGESGKRRVEKTLEFYRQTTKQPEVEIKQPEENQQKFKIEGEQTTKTSAYQLHNKYILAHIKTGMIVIDQQAAHERILFENYFEMVEKHKGVSQQQLFPQTLEFSAGDSVILKELNEELHALGFDINGFGKNTFIVHGIPADISDQNIFELLEKLIEDYKSSQGSKSELGNAKKEIVAKAMAKNLSIKSGDPLNHEEMSHMVDELFACKMPYASPSGKPTLITISLDELDKKLKK